MFYEQVGELMQYTRKHVKIEPLIGTILGSGLGSLVEMMKDKEVLSYRDIPYFPQSRVADHAGNLVFGRIGNQRLIITQGRFHYYEGFSMKKVIYPIYVMKLLGVRDLIVTNARGGINPDFEPGDLMIIDDFVNSLDINPLIGDNDERFGPRFPDMSEPYSIQLREKAEQVADQLTIPYCRGIYTLFQGPYYETAAEVRMYARVGSDAIGMSTVPEAVAANYLGIRVLGITCITSTATGIAKEKHSHEEVVKMVNKSSAWLYTWVEALLKEW